MRSDNLNTRTHLALTGSICAPLRLRLETLGSDDLILTTSRLLGRRGDSLIYETVWSLRLRLLNLNLRLWFMGRRLGCMGRRLRLRLLGLQ
jgi:hypothetical protein